MPGIRLIAALHAAGEITQHRECLELIELCSINLSGQSLTDDDFPDFVNDPTQNPDGTFLTVGIDVGRYEDTTWNFQGCGYFWGDECQSRIGYFPDKYLTLKILSESQAYFTGRDTTTDRRRREKSNGISSTLA